MVHYLQQANYIPALQLNHALKMNLVVSVDTDTEDEAGFLMNVDAVTFGCFLFNTERKGPEA